MGFRFSKRIKLMPGIRLNLGTGGASLSLGVRGASVTMGKRGVHSTVGIPGTGLSYRSRVDRPTPRAARVVASEPPLPDRFTLRFEPTGVTFDDEDGRPLAEDVVKRLRRTCRDRLLTVFREREKASTAIVNGLERLHLATPPPAAATRVPVLPQAIRRKPERPADPNAPHLDDAERAARRQAHQAYMDDLSRWRVEEAEAVGTEPDLVTTAKPVLDRLAPIVWPRETNISLDLDPTGTVLLLDVDLPELEDLPNCREVADERGAQLKVVPIAGTMRDRLYAAHVHAVLFRLVGEAFAAQGALREVRISGYTQRRTAATGQIDDHYVLSAKVLRQHWETIDFGHLNEVDPVAAFERFELRRKMSARGSLAPITPYA